MIRTIIIDDELKSRKLIRNILTGYCPNVEILAQAANVKEGVAYILKFMPDAVFLDIEMPDGTGFDLLEQIGDIRFQVIFITAFDKYAIKAIKFSALDYLLKPVEPNQLIDAVNKIEKPVVNFDTLSHQISTLLKNRNGIERIALPTLDGFKFISAKDIVRCRSDNNYTNFFLNSGEKIVVTRTLKEYEEILSDLEFVRVHQSHLVNVRYIDRYIKGDGGIILMADGSEVEVSRRRKDEFLRKLSLK